MADSSAFYLLKSFKEVIMQLYKNYIIIMVVNENCLIKNNLIKYLEENRINYDALYEVKTNGNNKNF
jgi:hypothetical protein